MISLLTSYWGPIQKIEKEVLKLFSQLIPVNGFRSLEFFASRFEGIRASEVTISNVPSVKEIEELRWHIVVPEDWIDHAKKLSEINSKTEEEKKKINPFVKIETIPR